MKNLKAQSLIWLWPKKCCIGLTRRRKIMLESHESVALSPLGKETTYISSYQPNLLFPISRKAKRVEIEVPAILPFKGVDIWNAFELSWLNSKGKPVVALGQFIVPCDSPNIFESKSLKLY